MNYGHIYIKGEVSREEDARVKQQLDSLENAGKKDIILHISSPGGSVYGGYNTYHLLKSSGRNITTIIEGECMSIATLIAMAGEKISIRRPSRYMIHNPSMSVQGSMEAKDFEKEAGELRRIEGEMSQIYAQKTGLPIEKVKEMMDRETGMNVDEALNYGFVDEVLSEIRAVALGKPEKMKPEDKTTLENFGEKLKKLVENIFPAGPPAPKNVDLPLQDGGMLFVDSEDPANLVGMPALIDGAPAPDGEYPLADGQVVVVTGGVVAEIRPAMSPEEQMNELRQQLEAAKNELAQIKNAKTEQEQTFAREIKALQSDYEAIKKMTVGSSEPPKKSVTAKKQTEGTEDYWSTATKDFLAENFPLLKRN